MAGELGVSEAGRLVGVHHSTIQHWIARYETEGAEGFLATYQNRVYSTELKMKSVAEYLSGKGSLQEICKKHGIREVFTLRQWIKVYNAHGDFNSAKQTGGESYMKQGRETTQEERIQIAKECYVLLGLGLIGSYLAAIFDEVKARPRYLVRLDTDTLLEQETNNAAE